MSNFLFSVFRSSKALFSFKMGRDVRSRRAKRVAATAVVAAAGFGFGIAALGLGAAAFAAGEFRSHAKGGGRRGSDGGFLQNVVVHRRKALSDKEFRNAIDREARVIESKFEGLRKRAASDGVQPELRPEVWPLLLGVRKPWSTAVEQEQMKRKRKEQYNALLVKCAELETLLGSSKQQTTGSTPSGKGLPFGSPTGTPNRAKGQSKNWTASSPMGKTNASPSSPSSALHSSDLSSYTENLPVINADVPRTAFHPGMAFQTHWVVERDFLLEDDKEENMERLGNKTLFDASPSKKQNPQNVPTWQAAQSKRLTNILIAYCLHDTAVGYCQGMNEVAARFCENVVDEAEAFWCFVEFLKAYRCHFIIDSQHGISSPPGIVTQNPTDSTTGVTRNNTTGKQSENVTRNSVRDVLTSLAKILKRCDPPMWKHVELLHAGDCMFAFRAVVVLLCRELPQHETVFLWEVLMAHGDFKVSSDSSEEDENGSNPTKDTKDALFQSGDGTLFLHIVAAAFIQSRHLIFACSEFDDLLHASHHTVRAKMTSASALVESGKKLMHRV